MSTTYEVQDGWSPFRPSALPDPEVWAPLERSQASRRIDARSQASARVFTQIDGREAILESHLEGKIQTVLGARRDVVMIEEQPAPVAFLDAEGKRRNHVFDFRLTLINGVRIAVDVKVGSKISEKFRSELSCMSRQVDASFAEGVLLLTEEAAPRSAVADALILNSVKQDTDYDGYAVLAEAIKSHPHPVTIRELGACLSRKTSGFRAVVRLIVAGFLVRVDSAPLTPDAVVRAASLICTVEG